MKTLTVKKRNLKHINLEELHQESRTWLSSISFWKDEVSFMHNLINKNFVYFFSTEKRGSLDALIKKITEIEKIKLNALELQVINHEKHLADYLRNRIEVDEENFKKEHATISHDLDLFQTNYRLIKTELFRVAEKVIKEKDIKQLIS